MGTYNNNNANAKITDKVSANEAVVCMASCNSKTAYDDCFSWIDEISPTTEELLEMLTEEQEKMESIDSRAKRIKEWLDTDNMDAGELEMDIWAGESTDGTTTPMTEEIWETTFELEARFERNAEKTEIRDDQTEIQVGHMELRDDQMEDDL